jgi:hypothetical protein
MGLAMVIADKRYTHNTKGVNFRESLGFALLGLLHSHATPANKATVSNSDKICGLALFMRALE